MICNLTDNFSKNDIIVIQGDTLKVNFCFCDIENNNIKEVLFTSNRANINLSLPYNEEEQGYILLLDCDTTEKMLSVICNYDLTIELADGTRKTMIHNGVFAVLKKRNKIMDS